MTVMGHRIDFACNPKITGFAQGTLLLGRFANKVDDKIPESCDGGDKATDSCCATRPNLRVQTVKWAN